MAFFFFLSYLGTKHYKKYSHTALETLKTITLFHILNKLYKIYNWGDVLQLVKGFYLAATCVKRLRMTVGCVEDKTTPSHEPTKSKWGILLEHVL